MADILVIDDDLDFARATDKVLESEGHEVEIPRTSRERSKSYRICDRTSRYRT